jgi:site-specific DNA recombinase
MKRAIIYTRVSTEEQAQSGNSLPHQARLSKAFCHVKGIEIMKHFEDNYSAKDFNRPAWNNLLEYVKSNKKNIDCLIFLKWDRFSRNAEQALKMIKLLKSYGKEIICIEQPLDLEINESKLMLAIFLIVPEIENDKISARTRDCMREAQMKGYWMGIPPFGYLNARDEDKKSTMVLSDKAIVVKESFELIATRLYSCEEVRREIIKKWNLKMCKQTFINLLRNITYTGRILIKEWKKEEAQIVQGNHQPIVTIELYNHVQDVLDGRRKQPKLHIKVSDSLPLRGHLLCPLCERNLTGSASTGRGKKKHYYYHCHKECSFRFRADEANIKFLKYLSDIKISVPVRNLYRKILVDVYKRKEGDKEIKLQAIASDVIKIKARKGAIQDSFADHKLLPDQYNEMNKRFDEQIMKLQEESTEIKMADGNFLKYMDFTSELMEKVDHFYDIAPVEVKRKILVSVFPEKLTFDKKKYRTAKANEVVDAITKKNKLFGRDKTKQATENGGLSNVAPSKGLEPLTI